MTRSIYFALVDSVDVHAFDQEMPLVDNLVIIEGDIAHAELIIPAGRAGPLVQLLGAGSVPPAPGPRDTSALERAAAHAQELAEELQRLVDGDVEEDDETPGWQP